MDLDTNFRVNSPNVVHETIDEEAVIINLMTGRYYSLEAVGVDLWDLVEGGSPIATMIEVLRERYDITNFDLPDIVIRFLDQLKDESLIVPAPSHVAEGADLSVPLNGGAALSEKPAFAPPILQKYTDMEALLLLDPIHEVDEAGWPVAKPDTSN